MDSISFVISLIFFLSFFVSWTCSVHLCFLFNIIYNQQGVNPSCFLKKVTASARGQGGLRWWRALAGEDGGLLPRKSSKEILLRSWVGSSGGDIVTSHMEALSRRPYRFGDY
jgi:hypothetical protein